MSRLAGVGFRPYSGATVLGGRRWEEEPVDPLTCQPHVGAPLQVRTNWYARNWEASSGLDWTIRGRSRVARVLTNAGRVTGVLLREHRRDGLVDEVIHAPMVVLGCGALESTALLLRSDIEDASGMMGRNITFTTEFVGYIKTDIRRSTAPHDVLGGRFANVSLRDDYDAPSADLLKGGKYALYDALNAESSDKHERRVRSVTTRADELLRHEQENYVLKLSFKGESIPWRGKRLRLSRSLDAWGLPRLRVQHQPHPHDLRLLDFVRTRSVAITRSFPGGLLLPDQVSATHWLTAHHHGGLIFGQNPNQSVLTPDCEHWRYRGLFVSDASSMPTSGATNCSHTVMANALRMSRAIADRLQSGKKDHGHLPHPPRRESR